MDLILYFPHVILSMVLLALFPLSAFAAPAESKEFSKSVLQESAAASKQWLELIDKGHYSESWENASLLMKKTIQKDGWEKLMTQTRKPLGNVISREVMDQRTAKNPPGMPAGDYIVMFYKTSFANRSTAYELTTLFLQNGKWSVVTYQIDQKNLQSSMKK